MSISDRVIRLFSHWHRVHKVTPDTVHARVLNDHRVATRAALLDVGTVTVWVAVGAANGCAHLLYSGTRLLTDPHQKHGFDGCEIAIGFRIVAFGDTLPVTAVEQVVTHDPAAAFTIGIVMLVPGGCKPGGVMGVLGEAGIPFVFLERGVPGLTQVVDLVKSGGAGRTGAGR